jgi:hypothetical protein
MAVTPQTADGMSFTDAEVAYQIEGDATETDMSGFASSVELGGFETQTGEGYTVNGDTAIMTVGKHGTGDVTVKSIYTEKDTDPTKKLFDAKTAKKRVKITWYPKGNAVGNWKWETDYGYLTSVLGGGGEASSADPLMTEIVLKTAKITPTTIAV